MSPEHARPLIYGHRGASAQAPENTLAAFQLAYDQGADGIELDAKLSADGEVVVIHDPTVDRTTQGKGAVNRLTMAQLRALDAGIWKGETFKGEKIPTLAEVLVAFSGRIIINIELTNYASDYDGLPQRVVELVRKFNVEDSVIISSFLQSNLLAVRRLWPEAPLGILAQAGFPGAINRSAFSRWVAPRYLHPHVSDVSERLVNREKVAGRSLNVWTVNAPADIRRMITLGVGGVITDDPALALTIREEK
jgi:glycerophosphoryl diester phosphodiesterase